MRSTELVLSLLILRRAAPLLRVFLLLKVQGLVLKMPGPGMGPDR